MKLLYVELKSIYKSKVFIIIASLVIIFTTIDVIYTINTLIPNCINNQKELKIFLPIVNPKSSFMYPIYILNKMGMFIFIPLSAFLVARDFRDKTIKIYLSYNSRMKYVVIRTFTSILAVWSIFIVISVISAIITIFKWSYLYNRYFNYIKQIKMQFDLFGNLKVYFFSLVIIGVYLGVFSFIASTIAYLSESSMAGMAFGMLFILKINYGFLDKILWPIDLYTLTLYRILPFNTMGFYSTAINSVNTKFLYISNAMILVQWLVLMGGLAVYTMVLGNFIRRKTV